MDKVPQLNKNHKDQLMELNNKEEAMELTVEWDNPDMEPLDNLDMELLDNLAMEQQELQDKPHMELEVEHIDHQDQVHTDQPQDKVELLVGNPGL